ncbi:hypothetical protein GobsT_22550 [Gemmata obscuriglobus]|nr:hypothetical protein GobsT_22550 [Gemmata obscuriglobus]VTS04517.1 unnamed protein product [Gemmata obscuriglobus UQM 2246]
MPSKSAGGVRCRAGFGLLFRLIAIELGHSGKIGAPVSMLLNLCPTRPMRGRGRYAVRHFCLPVAKPNNRGRLALVPKCAFPSPGHTEPYRIPSICPGTTCY